MRSSTWRQGRRGPDFSLQLYSVLLFLVQISNQQHDPVRNFCRRFGHQTAIIDRKLYIDGGFINWSPMSQYPANKSSKYTAMGQVGAKLEVKTTGADLADMGTLDTWLLYQDLDSSSPSGMPQLYGNLSKNESIPQVTGGVLWADDVNKRLYLYGGAINDASERLNAFELWSYDVIYDKWDSFGPSRIGIQRLAYGAGVGVSRTGKGYYYGGWMSNATTPGWNGLPAATSYLVTYDYDSNSWSNDTGPDDIPRAEGSMVFIPAADGGMLVYLGGITDLSGNGTAIQGQSLAKIMLLDVINAKWYIQDASGDVPDMRRRFCMDVTWTADRSSYNIYLYGGMGIEPDKQAGFDDVYVLSIPSFTWIKLEPRDRNGTGRYPHHTLTCNMVPPRSNDEYSGAGGGQMLVIGGTFPLTQDCDTPTQWGTHNLDLGAHDPWQIYKAHGVSYAVPSRVVSVIGGDATGGATALRPSNGWNNPDLGVVITRTGPVLSATRSPTRSIPTLINQPEATTMNAGQIAGIAIGTAIALVVAIVSATTLILCLLRKRKQNQRQQHHDAPISEQRGIENNHGAELSSDGQRFETDAVDKTGWEAAMQFTATPGEGSSPVESSNPPLSPFQTRPSSTLAQDRASSTSPGLDPPQIAELEGTIVPIELVAGSVVNSDAGNLEAPIDRDAETDRRHSPVLGDSQNPQRQPSIPPEDHSLLSQTDSHGNSDAVSPLSARGPPPPFDPQERGWIPQVSRLEMPLLPSTKSNLPRGSWRVFLDEHEEFNHSPRSMETVASGPGAMETPSTPDPGAQSLQLREISTLPDLDTPPVEERRAAR
ncbi:hypothetical protein PpBr36_03557 [Pyricularia pennisetigena]|uniref:hypothetical protein n=1 Tax=Pyricularia pennisetigena TaxID=1578925 RepID=UPI001153826C|nr:hypothetical protein PpBr36_03557 [Pyricularia pennisetigena]TLS30778.1 hypothetical protein PpBr36_03557 [Pyricularia pennisetigena]